MNTQRNERGAKELTLATDDSRYSPASCISQRANAMIPHYTVTNYSTVAHT